MFYTNSSQTSKQLTSLAETINGDFVSEIAKAAKENKIQVVGSFYEKSRKKDRVYDTAFVIDNPNQLFVGAIDAAAAQAEYGKTYGLTVTAAGSDLSGQSSSTLTYATRHATNNQWRLVRTAEDPENNDIAAANCSVVVAHNLNQYFTGAVTWQ